MLNSTIRDNIPLGTQDFEEEDVLRAAKITGAHAAIVDHAEGYDLMMGEAGDRLSSGQRRRIAAARAVIGNPPVLLMDEPSGDLDGEAEMMLARGLAALSKTTTVIVATHSPAILNLAHTLVVLDKGRVAMAGPAKTVAEQLNKANAQAAQTNAAQQAGAKAAQDPAVAETPKTDGKAANGQNPTP